MNGTPSGPFSRSRIFLVLAVAAALTAAGLIMAPGIIPRLVLLAALAALGFAAKASASLIKERNTLWYRLQACESSKEEYIRNTQRTVSEEKINVINKFSSIVSHELKNPLASLKNIAFFFSRGNKFEDERSRKMLEMLSTEIDRANQMVNDLLDLSRVKKISKRPSKLNEIIDAAVTETALAEPIHVIRSLAPVNADVDPDRFKQIMTSLLTNSRDAMPNGGEITISLAADQDSAVVVFQDTGIGMDQDTLAHIFEPLFTTKTKVLGFGLTIVKQIVALHNGAITAESEKGRGTTFRVTLPLH